MKVLQKRDIAIWLVSVTVVIISNILSGKFDIVNLTATFLGATSLILLAKGNVWGNIIMIVFSILYGIASFRYRYWGEMLTYLGMTLPMAVLSTVSWLKNPSAGNKNEVIIQHLSKKQIVNMAIFTLLATLIFGVLLVKLNTPNIVFSVLSITTSFLAAYLSFQRSTWYAFAYALNDIVLIVLWVLASIDDVSNLPMVANFTIFLFNDAYGFYSWKKREKTQI